jgi:hypothetical protein
LSGPSLNYSTYDKELYALVRTLQTWQQVLACSSSKIFRLDCFHRLRLDQIAILDVSVLLVLAGVHVSVRVSITRSLSVEFMRYKFSSNSVEL